MVTQLSPGVLVTETDQSAYVPAVATSNGGTVLEAAWGPVDVITTIDSEQNLVSQFGKPGSSNYEGWFAAASFLAYATNLKLVRVVGTGALNATASASAGTTGQLIKNQDEYENTSFSTSTDLWIAKYPGALGNSIQVAWCDTAGFDVVDSSGDYTWAYRDLFDSAPDASQFHIVVVDVLGNITGTAGTVLETFDDVSLTSTAKRFDGSTNYVVERLKTNSAYINVAKASLLTGASSGVTLAGGANGATAANADLEAGWALFQSVEDVDVTTLFVGGASSTVGKWVIDNIAEVRKDCVVFVSPAKTDCVNVSVISTILTNVKATRTVYGNSNYAFMDSTWKYQYDRYADTYRWVPLNGDIAGLMAKTSNDVDAWFSPAGLNRGRIKNVVKFAYTQAQTTRDELYKSQINPCVIFPNEGAILYGDKTLQTKPSAFDRINVRMLFITLEKSIAIASKYVLFEFNDEITRRSFINTVEPFLRDVQGRRGVVDYLVICDETNNTGEVIDRNEFVANLFIKPTRSINFIKLNFIATRTGVSFEEIVA